MPSRMILTLSGWPNLFFENRDLDVFKKGLLGTSQWALRKLFVEAVDERKWIKLP